MLTSVTVIAFGAALVLSSNSVWHLHVLKHAMATAESQSQLAGREIAGSEILASEMASGSARIQALAGLAAIVLGILAVVGTDVTVLTLVALLALGATLVMSGSTLSGTVMNLMRPLTQT